LAELSHSVWSLRNELQVPFQVLAVALRDFICPIIHDSVFEFAPKMDHPLRIVDPKLLPTLQACVVAVKAFALIGAIQACPVLQYHAVVEYSLDLARSCGHAAVCCNHIPLPNPKIKLAIFRGVGAWVLIAFGLFDKLEKRGLTPHSG